MTCNSQRHGERQGSHSVRKTCTDFVQLQFPPIKKNEQKDIQRGRDEDPWSDVMRGTWTFLEHMHLTIYMLLF